MSNAPHKILDETDKEIPEISVEEANQFTLCFTLISIFSLQRPGGDE
jgi:hypothetical protein